MGQAQMTEISLAVVGIVLGLLSGLLGYLLVSRPAAARALRVERSQAYLQLEIASIDTFRFRAEYAYAIVWSLDGSNPKRLRKDILAEQVDQYYYQCLNLFEVVSRFRKEKVIAPEIYASWVAWFFEVLEVRYFREQWRYEYRDNYTRELQQIFDDGIELFERFGLSDYNPGPEEQGQPGAGDDRISLLRDAFYRHVAWVVPCSQIQDRSGRAERSSEQGDLATVIYRRRHKLHSVLDPKNASLIDELRFRGDDSD